MDGFIIFACLLGAFVLLLRFLRARETRAFLKSDMSATEALKARSAETVVDPLMAKAQAYALEAEQAEKTAQATKVSTIGAQPRFQLKDIIFAESHRLMLQALELELPSRYRLFVHVPLLEFVKTSNPEELEYRSISFLVCDRHYLKVIAGIELQTASANSDHLNLLQSLFDEINLLLIRFPTQTEYSAALVRQKLRLITQGNKGGKGNSGSFTGNS